VVSATQLLHFILSPGAPSFLGGALFFGVLWFVVFRRLSKLCALPIVGS
jgi:hypothetical protein